MRPQKQISYSCSTPPKNIELKKKWGDARLPK